MANARFSSLDLRASPERDGLPRYAECGADAGGVDIPGVFINAPRHCHQRNPFAFCSFAPRLPPPCPSGSGNPAFLLGKITSAPLSFHQTGQCPEPLQCRNAAVPAEGRCAASHATRRSCARQPGNIPAQIPLPAHRTRCRSPASSLFTMASSAPFWGPKMQAAPSGPYTWIINIAHGGKPAFLQAG